MSKSVMTYVEVPLSSFPEGAELVPKITRLPGTMGKAAFRVTITAKEKRYVLRLEDTEDSDNEFAYYASVDDGHWIITDEEIDPDCYHSTVTQADIDSAPAWVKAIKPVEATDHAEANS